MILLQIRNSTYILVAIEFQPLSTYGPRVVPLRRSAHRSVLRCVCNRFTSLLSSPAQAKNTDHTMFMFQNLSDGIQMGMPSSHLISLLEQHVVAEASHDPGKSDNSRPCIPTLKAITLTVHFIHSSRESAVLANNGYELGKLEPDQGKNPLAKARGRRMQETDWNPTHAVVPQTNNQKPTTAFVHESHQSTRIGWRRIRMVMPLSGGTVSSNGGILTGRFEGT
jgi:hypothetical protein